MLKHVKIYVIQYKYRKYLIKQIAFESQLGSQNFHRFTQRVMQYEEKKLIRLKICFSNTFLFITSQSRLKNPYLLEARASIFLIKTANDNKYYFDPRALTATQKYFLSTRRIIVKISCILFRTVSKETSKRCILLYTLCRGDLLQTYN